MVKVISWVILFALLFLAISAMLRPQVMRIDSVRWNGHSYITCGYIGGHLACVEADELYRVGDTITIP